MEYLKKQKTKHEHEEMIQDHNVRKCVGAESIILSG